MTSRLRTTLFFIAVLLWATPAVFAGPDKDRTEIYLAAMGARDIEHGQDTPLLLQVNIFNELKPVSIGSKNKLLASLVRFEVKDSNGGEAKLTIRVLAESADKKDAVNLKADRVSLYFGVEPDALATLPKGVYRPQAFVNGASSAPVTVKLRKTGPARDDTQGLYYRLDRRFDMLLAHAERMVGKEAGDPAGHIYMGDALAGLGRGRDALGAYDKALMIHKVRSKGAVLVEDPRYIKDRIEEILEKKVS